MNIFEIIIGILVISIVTFLLIKNKQKIKESLQKKIEKNAIKIPNATWTDRKGNIHTEDIIIKRSVIPLIGDWGRVYPLIDEYGKVNWINTIFGSKQNFIKLLIVLGIVALVLLAFAEFFNSYEALKQVCEPYLNSTQDKYYILN